MFAQTQFVLDERQPDGATTRAHLERVFKQTGLLPDQLAEEPECPDLLYHVWSMFLGVSARRRGTEVISNQEMLAWAHLHHVEISAFEAVLLDNLEYARRQYYGVTPSVAAT